jgi:TonB-dependent receptor
MQLKLLLMASATLISLSLEAHAAATPTRPSGSDATDAVQEVVVTGTRASMERAVQIKKNADQVIDTVSASEIGELPDFNAGDALKRVTGVNALLYQGEPRFVIIRGFNASYNDTLIDGFSFAATDLNMGSPTLNGRQVGMELLPSNLASHIDVIKSARAEDDSNWAGGLINMATPSGFDFKNGELSAAISGGTTVQSESIGGNRPDAEASIAFARRFGADQQFSFYGSATYWVREVNVSQGQTGSRYWFTSAGAQSPAPYSGTGLAVPTQRLLYNYDNHRDRVGLQLRVDWRPSDSLSAYVNTYAFRQEERSNRSDFTASLGGSTTIQNQVADAGALANVSQYAQLGRYRWHRNLDGIEGRLKMNLRDWTLDLGSSISVGSVNNPQIAVRFTQSGLRFNYSMTSEGMSVFTPVDAAKAGTLANYTGSSWEPTLGLLNENRYDNQINLSRNMAETDRGLGLKFGVRMTNIIQHVTMQDTVYAAPAGVTFNLANASTGATICGYDCSTPIPLINAAMLDQTLAGLLPTATVSPNVANMNGGTYQTFENVTAAYAEAKYQTDLWAITGGLRFENTDGGSSTLQGTAVPVVANGKTTSVISYAPATASISYSNVLPSVLLVYHTSPSSKLRFSIGETLSRPTFGQSSLHGGVLNLTTNPPTLTVGNPNLKPRQTLNLDIGHDWYIDDGKGIISIAVFAKDIKNDIFTYGQPQTVGSTPGVLVTQARNTNRLVRDTGLEIGFSHSLSVLPEPFNGLGISGNAVFSRARFPVTLSDGSVVTLHQLPDQSAQIYNASVYYDKGAWHGRIAWNHLSSLWDDRYPNFTPTGFYQNSYQQPTNNFDIQASYRVTEHISVDFRGLNITQQGIKDKLGARQEFTGALLKLPSEFLIGIKFVN